MEKNNVLDLIVGLDREHVKTFQGLVFPILRVLRENIETGQPTMTINLDCLGDTCGERSQQAGVVSSRSTKDN